MEGAPLENESLRFLSREERECIRFLEETIDSLDEDLDEPDEKRLSGSANPAVHRPITAATVMMSGRSVNPKDQDIIDLVQKQPKEALYSSIQQDFRSMTHPETHFEMKAKPDPLGNLPYDLKLPPTVTPSAANNNPSATSQPQYQPAGFVPTPVIIAQKLAAHQRAAGISLPSSILSNSRRSLDSNPQDHASTAAKPSHYPDNISVIMGSKHNDALPPINVQERKAQVLTHLTGPLQLEDTGTKNTPIRSSSYRDPTQDRTRMEALSKLGLNANQPSSTYALPNASLGPLASRPEPVPSDVTGLSHQSSGDGATAGAPPSQAERRLSFSKPAAQLRPQGITVQFTGRGPTDQSRKDALRVLGLLKKGSGYSS
uniref:Proline and serine-rich protein 2-like n=1 Tax=Paramormyrops kingsleyae TaxID=1676925 RepID=A0A3B3QWS1_9TELE